MRINPLENEWLYWCPSWNKPPSGIFFGGHSPWPGSEPQLPCPKSVIQAPCLIQLHGTRKWASSFSSSACPNPNFNPVKQIMNPICSKSTATPHFGVWLAQYFFCSHDRVNYDIKIEHEVEKWDVESFVWVISLSIKKGLIVAI